MTVLLADPGDLMGYHIIVTTYQILASEFAASTGAKDEGSKAGKGSKGKKVPKDEDDTDDDNVVSARSLCSIPA